MDRKEVERGKERKESLELNKLNKKRSLFPVLLSINLYEIEKIYKYRLLSRKATHEKETKRIT